MLDQTERIKALFESREKLKKRLKILEKSYQEEKGNEDAWPGHDTNFLLQLQQDEQLVISMLKEVEKVLKELGIDLSRVSL